MEFSEFNLDARLMRAIAAAGYTTPTPIQAAAIPVALEGHDLIGTAQTGTGKTAAFALPILHKLLSRPAQGRRARALVLTPTRELAEQINEAFRQLAQFTNVRSATIYGGVGMGPQVGALRAGVEVLIACPGRLLDHMGQGTARLDGIEIVVLDEADRMLDMGFMPSVRRIIEKLPSDRQTMLFSATFPGEVEGLAGSALHKPRRVAIGIAAPARTVSHAMYPVASHLKPALLIELLKRTDAYSMLVFARTKHRASRLAKQIEREGFKTAALHGDKSQNQRQQALDGFRSGKFQVLVATDIAARGLDVETVSHVMNFDVPDTPDAYIHRIGRTGRAERTGDAFTLVTPEDHEVVRDIERTLSSRIERRKLDGFDYGAPMPERVQPAITPVGPVARYAPAGDRPGFGPRGSQRPAGRGPGSRPFNAPRPGRFDRTGGKGRGR